MFLQIHNSMGNIGYFRGETQNNDLEVINKWNGFRMAQGPKDHNKLGTALGSINENQVRRVFDKPIIASSQATMSQECVSCSQRGIGCIFVRYITL